MQWDVQEANRVEEWEEREREGGWISLPFQPSGCPDLDPEKVSSV